MTLVTRKQVPNVVTGLRLAALPVLWGFALADQAVVVGAGLVFAWFTDALDGTLARVLDARSEWGSQFDSISDTLFFVSAMAWVVLLRPEFVVDHALLLGLWVGIGVITYSVAFFRFRRLPDIHLLSAKAANFVGFLFVAHLIAFGDAPEWVARTVLWICIAAAVETFVAVTAFPRRAEGTWTIFQRRP